MAIIAVSGARTGNEFVNADNRKSISNFLYYTFPFDFFQSVYPCIIYIYDVVIVIVLLDFRHVMEWSRP